MAPMAGPAAASLSILSPPYRLTTIGIVSLVALIAFEALAAMATAMPVGAQALVVGRNRDAAGVHPLTALEARH